MIKDSICTDGDARGQHLVSYLYDDMPSDERASFERHLQACLVCRAEFDALGDVRADLRRWKAPELAGRITFRASAEPSVAPALPSRSWWREMPAWAQTAAALLLLGAAAGAANLEVSYGSTGLSVRTGWNHASPAPAAASVEETASVPWQADLDALARDLRSEVAAQAQTAAVTPASSAGVVDDVVLKRVRGLLQESEQRQQRELALRVGEIVREVQSQRQADLVKIDRNLGLLQRSTGMEVMRTQQQLNSLVQRVSQRQ